MGKQLLVIMAPKSAIISDQECENNRVYFRQPHSFGGPRSASNRTPDQSSWRSEVNTSCVRPRAQCGNTIARMASDVSLVDVAIPPPAVRPSAHPPAEPTSNTAGRKHTLFAHFPEDPELRSMQTHESYEGVMHKTSWRSGGQNYDRRKIWGYDNSRPQGS